MQYSRWWLCRLLTETHGEKTQSEFNGVQEANRKTEKQIPTTPVKLKTWQVLTVAQNDIFTNIQAKHLHPAGHIKSPEANS